MLCFSRRQIAFAAVDTSTEKVRRWHTRAVAGVEAPGAVALYRDRR
jgi:hypothetical protein